MRYQEIFTPNDMPTITYVDRPKHNFERQLKEFYELPNVVVSVSGPSKSGKTVLIKKIVSVDNLITVRGASIKTPEDLWNRVLDWMGDPSEFSESNDNATELSGSVETGGKIGIPLVVEGSAKGAVGGKRGWGTTETKSYRRSGLEQVIKEIAKSEFVVFIDDFHYIEPKIREDVGRQIKAAAESGVKIFAASVPHRADDVVLSNKELRGRVVGMNIEPWDTSDLTAIATKGFAALNVELTHEIECRFARESFGSPQLMQSICLRV